MLENSQKKAKQRETTQDVTPTFPSWIPTVRPKPLIFTPLAAIQSLQDSELSSIRPYNIWRISL